MSKNKNMDNEKEYAVLFTNKGKKICICRKTAKTEEDAMMNAEFALMARYSNVEYDKVEISKGVC